MNLRNTYILLRDLNFMVNARQDDVRLLLAHAGIVPEEGAEISFKDIWKALELDADFGKSLYTLLYGQTANAGGDVDWMDWVQGVTGGLSTMFGTINSAKLESQSSSKSNQDVLDALNAMANKDNEKDKEKKSNTMWIVGGCILGALVIGIIVVVIIKKRKR